MFCLDASVAIDTWRGRYPAVTRRLASEIEAGTLLLIPAIVLYEWHCGAEISERWEANHRRIAEFLSAPVSMIPFDAEDAAEAAAIRAALRQTPIGPDDLLIAAQARRRRSVLVSANRDEFERVPGLMVQDWRRA